LGQVKGVDGIKTGYTEASGYNLVSSVRRDEKHIVAVVLGGTSNAARDARMRQLIEDDISLASTQRTVPVIVDADGRRIADEGWALYLAAQWLEDAQIGRAHLLTPLTHPSTSTLFPYTTLFRS